VSKQPHRSRFAGRDVIADIPAVTANAKCVFSAILAMASRRPHRTPLLPGVRVVRGPDWQWADQDGGEGHVGTVVEVGGQADGRVALKAPTPSGTVVVQWDTGVRSNYRVGYGGSCDLIVLDNAAAGVRHDGVDCAECGSKGFPGIRWLCAVGPEAISMCSPCYNAGRGNLDLSFRRYDSPEAPGTFLAPPRSQSRKLAARGLYPGAKVVRSLDWEWEDAQDGGGENQQAPSVGEVLAIEAWERDSSRSVARVYWPRSGGQYQYRVGHRGRVDVHCFPDGDASGGFYYPDHLPVAGGEEPVTWRQAPDLAVGDRVRLAVTLQALRDLQTPDHGGFHARMASLIGSVGRVHRLTSAGDVRVQFSGKPEADHRWTLHPASLAKLSQFEVNDLVRVIDDEEEVKRLQRGHGEWSSSMRLALGTTGVVVQVYQDGDVRVRVGQSEKGKVWTMNPVCLRPEGRRRLAQRALTPEEVDGAADDFAEVVARGDISAIKRSLSAATPPGQAVRRAFLDAAKRGRSDLVELLLAHFPAEDDYGQDFGGRTPLHVAVHAGHLGKCCTMANFNVQYSHLNSYVRRGQRLAQPQDRPR